MFVNTDTGTVDPADWSAYLVDLDAPGDDVKDRFFGDDFFDDGTVCEVVDSNGVSVAELWEAYQWRQAFRRGMADANLSTGVTYGDPDSVLSVAYDMGRNYGEQIGGGK